MANWKIPYQWRFLAGKIIYFYGPFSIAMLNNQKLTGKMMKITSGCSRNGNFSTQMMAIYGEKNGDMQT